MIYNKIVIALVFLLCEAVVFAEPVCCKAALPYDGFSKLQSREIGQPIPDGINEWKLQSYEEAEAVLFIDMDGAYSESPNYNKGEPVTSAHPQLSTDQMYQIWQIVSEDYRPFNINVTTDSTVFAEAPSNRRIRAIATPTWEWYGQRLGGLCYAKFADGADDPAYIWTANLSNDANMIGECVSHEVGHAMGLLHDGTTTPAEQYYKGHGNWAPIMGASYYRSLSQWSKGEYTNALAAGLDDVEIIASNKNGFGYRPDLQGDSISTAATLIYGDDGVVNGFENSGVIHRADDQDYFLFKCDGGEVSFHVKPSEVDPNLDIRLDLLNAQGDTLYSESPKGIANLDARLIATLPQGEYYLVVDGTGEGDPAVDGYSDYGSLGYYEISGTIENSLPANMAPELSILSPEKDEELSVSSGDYITFSVKAVDVDGAIESVVAYIGIDTLLLSQDGDTYSAQWREVTFGKHIVLVEARDNMGRISRKELTFQVTMAGVTLADQSPFSIHSFSSQETDYGMDRVAEYVLDGDLATFWSSEMYDFVPAPHTISLNLDGSYEIYGFYLGNNGNEIGRKAKEVELYISDDGVNWGEPVLQTTLDNTQMEENLYLTDPITGSYIKLVVLESYGSMSVELSELNILVSKDGDVNAISSIDGTLSHSIPVIRVMEREIKLSFIGAEHVKGATLLDLSGRIQKEVTGSDINAISTTSLATGLYLLRLESTSNRVYNQKIMIK